MGRSEQYRRVDVWIFGPDSNRELRTRRWIEEPARNLHLCSLGPSARDEQAGEGESSASEDQTEGEP